MQTRNQLLVIGGLPNRKRGIGYGGAVVLMENFVEYMKSKGIPFRFIQTDKFYHKGTDRPNRLLDKFYFLPLFLLYLPLCHTVMFNFSDHATVSMYPILAKLSKLLGKKVVFRKFGGSLDLYLSNKPERIRTRTFKAISRADLILLETKRSIHYMRSKLPANANIEWFPNVRRNSSFRVSPKFQRRFVFISHIQDEKGVSDLLDVAKELPEGYTVDLYGPIKDKKYERIDWKKYHVNYGGTLAAHNVPKVLARYNVLLLPSHREGYPGIILEAMSIAMPVISTRAGGIPEIVDDGQTGLLTDAGNKTQLRDSIRAIDQTRYSKMSGNALSSFSEKFNSEVINQKIVQKINNLA